MIDTPWARFPEYPVGSMAWRMGRGEHALYEWQDFVRTLDEAAFIAHLESQPPAPFTWRSTLAHHGRRFGMNAGALHRFSQVDAAYTRWCESSDARHRDYRPWLQRRRAVPIDLRAIWFWSRDQKRAREAGGALEWRNEPDESQRAAWGDVLDAACTGETESRDLVAQVATGSPKAPWQLGVDAAEHRSDAYTSAWRTWLRGAFDDRATCAPFVAGMSDEWSEVLRPQLPKD